MSFMICTNMIQQHRRTLHHFSCYIIKTFVSKIYLNKHVYTNIDPIKTKQTTILCSIEVSTVRPINSLTIEKDVSWETLNHLEDHIRLFMVYLSSLILR